MQKYCRIVTSIYEKSEELWELVKYGRNDEEDDLFFITSYYGYMYIFLSVFYLCLPLVGVTPVHALGFLGLKREFGEIKGTFRRPALVRSIKFSILSLFVIVNIYQLTKSNTRQPMSVSQHCQPMSLSGNLCMCQHCLRYWLETLQVPIHIWK